MPSLGPHLRERRDSGRKLLVPYVTGGIVEDWVEIIEAYADAGADAVEVGIPFSDPVMDGPTIQEASEVALRRGTTPMSIFSDLRDLDVDIPLVAMSYYNIAFRSGLERFAAEAAAAHISGAILPDAPLEEIGDWLDVARPAGIETVMLAAPNSTDERLARLCATSEGFVYGVNLLGVTGERTSVAGSAGALAGRLKALTDLPVIMGFGISTPEQAVDVASASDGVIVASAIMRLLLDGGDIADAGEVVGRIRTALDAA
ncbi:MAG TPA: tryptophan synthase subunit alpha [Acidimicrobiales bacterium]|nr:tryptophan synthase subunit alpha [Acidimicrobiales bacterium]